MDLEMERLKAEGLAAIHSTFDTQRTALNAEIDRRVAEINRELAAMDRVLIVAAIVVVAVVLWMVIL